jgi:RimJ/RimL family protein N-acetyltransferase
MMPPCFHRACTGAVPAATKIRAATDYGREALAERRRSLEISRGTPGPEHIMVAIPTLETPRLRLRRYRYADFEAYAALWTEPAVIRFIGGAPLTRELAWTRFLRQIGLWHHLGFGFFALELKANGALVGEAGFHDLKRALTPSLEGCMEAGWALSTAAQGQGLAEEAMRAALAWAGEHRPNERITCIIHPDHAASLHVAGKLGFRRVGETTYNDHPVVMLERPNDA